MSDFLETMEQSSVADAARSAPQPLRAAGPTDWFAFRRKHPDLWIAKTGEDGCVEEWQQLLRDEGATRLDNAILRIRRTLPKGNKINLAAILAELQPDPVPNAQKTDLAGTRSKVDLLVWCIVHSPTCYADSRCQWEDGDGMVDRHIPGYGTIKVKERICKQGLTVWEKMRDKAAEAQAFIFAELGKDITPLTKPSVYHTVTSDPRWLAYLCGQRLIP